MADAGTDAHRGRLELAPRVVTRLAEAEAARVPGVVRHAHAMEKLVGRTLPRVSATVDRDLVRLEVEVALEWPCEVDRVAAEVRRRVMTETSRLTGLEVRSAHVSVEIVHDADADDDERRVQ